MSDPSDRAQRRFAALKEHFSEVFELEHDARHSYLTSLGAEDPEMARELEKLLAPSTDTDIVGRAFATAQADTIDGFHLAPGVEIGPYTLTEELGRGGMGHVFIARRERPERTVALKILRGHNTNETFVRRFEFEGQVLARLNHPNIAHVYESGAERLGDAQVLWYAMELVENARTLDRVIADSSLKRADQFALFLDLCDAVAYAHQRGVLHRDLKPANVLVDERMNLKLIDFGIAKPLDPYESPDVDLTRAGQIVGTLAYMSPEQARGTGEPTDVRADVYALGVIAYELLTGKLPIDLRNKSLLECVAAICNAPVDAAPLEAAGVKADAQLILRKALAKDPDERYASVDALAADIRRFIRDEPILARPPSLLYQARKFAKRNRLLVSASLVTVLAVFAGGIASTVGLLRARAAQAEAERSRDRAQTALARAETAERAANQAADFAVELLVSADPYEGASSETTMLEAAERAAARLDAGESLEPVTEYRLRMTLAQLFLNLERGKEANAHAERAVATARDEAQRLAAESLRLGALIEGHLADDVSSGAKDNFEAHVAEFGADDERTLDAEALYLDALAGEGQLELARSEIIDLLDRQVAVLGPRSQAVLDARFRLAEWSYNAGDLTGALEAFEQLEADAAARHGADHPLVLGVRLRLAQVTQASGDGASAVAQLDALRPDVERVLGRDHEMTLGVLTSQANLAANDDERIADALPIYREILDRLAPDHPARRTIENNYAFTLVRLERYDEAEQIYARAWPEQRDAPPGTRGSYLVTACNYATLLERTDRRDAATRLLRDALARGRDDFGPKFWTVEVIAARLALLEGKDPPVPTSERARKFLRRSSPEWAARLDGISTTPVTGG